MEEFVNGLYTQMENELNEIAKQADVSRPEQEAQSIHLIREFLQRLKVYMADYNFSSQQEEIHYFKAIKPRFYQGLIYHAFVYRMEALKPNAGDAQLKKEFQKESRRITQYMKKHKLFYTYCQGGAQYLDAIWFVRQKNVLLAIEDDYSHVTDPVECPVACYLIARLQAGENMQLYIASQLVVLEHKNNSGALHNNYKSSPNLQWNASKTDLIELLYALYSSKSFGKTELKKIVTFFQTELQIDLGNYPRVFQQIRIRKKNPTLFLDHMKEELLRHMDEVDEQFH